MRQTNDQQAATEGLRAQAGPYRVTLDAEGWPMIEGRYGQIEQHDGALLAVYSTSMRLLRPLLAAGARKHQVGDDEYRLLFEPQALGAIARVIRARRRRQGGSSAEHMARIRPQRLAQSNLASVGGDLTPHDDPSPRPTPREMTRLRDMKRSPFSRQVMSVVRHGWLRRLVLECGHSRESASWVLPRMVKCETCAREQGQQKARAKGAAGR